MSQPAVHLDDLPIPDLRAAIVGDIVEPGDPGYDDARRVENATFDRRPSLVVRAADERDVAAVVAFARRTDLALAVRAGGHSLAGHSVADGGLVLDLGRLRGMEVDPAGRTAWAQAGLTAREYTSSAARHGLTTGFGDTGSVGIAGLTLGGGMGWLVRKHGLTVDDLLAAELVTAEGEVLHVDDDTHPELFWALLGGGGNFGVVTRLRYRLHPIGAVIGGMLVLPADPAALRSLVAIAAEAPDELSLIIQVMKAPPMPGIPADHHGRPVMIGLLVYAGDVEAGQRVIAPIRALTTPLVDDVRAIPYPEMYPDEEAPRAMLTVRSTFIDDVDAATAEDVLERLGTASFPMAAVQIRVLGGAVARVPVDATAFAHRQRGMLVTAAAGSEQHEDASARRQWVDGVVEMLPAARGAFVSFLSDDGEARVREAYPGTTYDRLRAVKRRYDRTNLFRGNQNVDPGT